MPSRDRVVAEKRPVDYAIRRRIGRQPARKMQRLAVETRVDMPIGGHVVYAGVPCLVDVTIDAVQYVMASVETDHQALTRAQEEFDREIDKMLSDQQLTRESPDARGLIDTMPNSLSRTFYEMNRRSIRPLVSCELVGEPFDGHPDGLHMDTDLVSDDDRQAAIIAKAIAAAMPAMVGSLSEIVERAVDKRLESITGPSKTKG